MMSAKAGKRPLRSLTAHEKLEAIRRVHDGESKASVARDIGVPESTLRGWCKNEEKISYISRQSSPETDDSIHGANYDPPKEKKSKIDETPYNLSLKPAPPNPRLSYSPGAETKYPPVVDYSVTQDEKPLNLNLKSAEKSAITERERNRAELARLSIELGLNRPEMYTPSSNTLADLSSNINLLSQWNNLLLQQQVQPAKQSKKVTAPADTSTNVTSSQPLLTTTYNSKAEKSSEKSPKLGKLEPPKSVDESVWYWLKTQQAMLNLTQSQTNLGLAGTSLPATTLPNDQNSSWFWKWYKQYTQASAQLQNQQQQQQLASPPQENKQILYQQLTKDSNNVASGNEQISNNNSENFMHEDINKPKHLNGTGNGNKARAVLDNLLLNNNNNTISTSHPHHHHEHEASDKLDEDDLTQSEALEHGEKFLKWLECCSEPSVTAMQIMQFRGLINNIKSGVDRKNGDQQKAKVRRK